LPSLERRRGKSAATQFFRLISNDSGREDHGHFGPETRGKVLAMLGDRRMVRFGLVVCLCLPLGGAVACGGGGAKTAHAVPKAGDMPEGGEWTGVYFSPTYGYLHLVKEGSSLSGKWRTAAGDKWGEMHGEVAGDLFNFEWRETRIGMVGPSATATGRGYFKYVHPPGQLVNDEIDGEWGLGTDTGGVTWTAVKQRNMKPDPDSVVPDETQKVEGGEWDEKKKKKSQGGGDSDKKSDEWN
jgi:hypothetical protein